MCYVTYIVAGVKLKLIFMEKPLISLSYILNCWTRSKFMARKIKLSNSSIKPVYVLTFHEILIGY